MSRILFVFLFLALFLTTPTIAYAANESCPYKLPWSSWLPVIVSQGISDSTNKSHKPGTLEEFAIDFYLREGAAVVASREGTVSAIHDGETLHGNNVSFAKYANFVIIDHGDGTFGVYYHLQKTAFSKEDIGTKKVVQGELIGYSGNTGWSTNPHLHFQVQNRGNKLAKSIPFCFSDVPGGVPKLWRAYTSENKLVTGYETKPTATLPPTKTPPPKTTQEPDLGAFDRSDARSVARWIVKLIQTESYTEIEKVVGEKGAAIGPYGIGFHRPGFNNGEEFGELLEQAFGNAKPACAGYQTIEAYEGDTYLYVVFYGVPLGRWVGDPQYKQAVVFWLTNEGGNFDLLGLSPLTENDFNVQFSGEMLNCPN